MPFDSNYDKHQFFHHLLLPRSALSSSFLVTHFHVFFEYTLVAFSFSFTPSLFRKKKHQNCSSKFFKVQISFNGWDHDRQNENLYGILRTVCTYCSFVVPSARCLFTSPPTLPFIALLCYYFIPFWPFIAFKST